MADGDALDFDLMHAQITAQISAQFPAFKTVEFYRDDEAESMPTPAILLDVSEAEPELNEDSGTGELPMFLRFEARIIMGMRVPQVRAAVRKAALALTGWLHLRTWGNGVVAGPCQVLACTPDEFDPRLDKWAVWRVEWRQLVWIGENVWANDNAGVVPTSYFSFAPTIGSPHKDEYSPV